MARNYFNVPFVNRLGVFISITHPLKIKALRACLEHMWKVILYQVHTLVPNSVTFFGFSPTGRHETIRIKEGDSELSYNFIS